MFKKVGYCYYVHKSNIKELSEILDKKQKTWLNKVLVIGNTICNYSIVKYNKMNENISLIECEDWDTSNEPIVCDSFCFNIDGNMKIIKGGSKVYHNKWQFVSSDYKGFDIEKAKNRTEEWNKIEDIKGLKNKIGSKKFWHDLLRVNNIEI